MSTIKRRRPTYPSAKQLAERAAWGKQFHRCWVCGGAERLQTHEMASRAQAAGKWADVRNYARVCQVCHAEHFSWLNEVVQLAHKAINDPEYLDCRWVNEARGRHPEAVTIGEVVAWTKFIQAVRGQPDHNGYAASRRAF